LKEQRVPDITPITSRDNPLVKELRKLSQDGAAYRKTGRFWIEGEHLCEAYLAKSRLPDFAVVSESKQPLAQQNPALAAIKLIVLPDALMAELSGLESVAGMGFMCKLPQDVHILPTAKTVILDRLQDPGNVGSILRSAAHFGLHLVEGAALSDLDGLQHPLAVTSSHQGQYLHQLLYLKSLSKTEPPTLDLSTVNWVFGHEGQGANEALMTQAKLHVRIAQPGGEESLNVAAAAAICLHASGTVAL
jgi:RNA methyltransferase, TrmH family